MSLNPDNDIYLGLGPQETIKDDDGNDMNMNSRYLIPEKGMLRFAKRVPEDAPAGFVKHRLILQQYQWCAETGDFGWYDIPLVTE